MPILAPSRRGEPVLDYRPVLLIVGLLLVTLGVAMLLPGLVELARRLPSGEAFVASALVTIFVGGLMVTANRVEIGRITKRQTFILVVLAWVLLPGFAALPFVFSDLQLSYTDAYFEAMPGLTTTGSTVLVGLDSMAPRHPSLARAAAVARRHRHHRHGDGDPAALAHRWHAAVPCRVL